jgi:tRNA pseudouridine38-40 synthase
MRYQAKIEYDGTAYYGFQRQKGHASIQETIELAVATIAGKDVRLIAAGRTDSGVHAEGQVIVFDLEWRHDPKDLLQALNSNLPADVCVFRLSETERDFHPRFQAKSRIYEYHIYNRQIRSPLRRLHAWHVARPLEIGLMKQAAASIIGTYDFATFGQPPQGVNTVRQVIAADWLKREDLLVFSIEANAFLYRMVRSLVGSMKMVGEGSWTVDEFVDALEAHERSRAAQTAPPNGVFLKSVRYE